MEGGQMSGVKLTLLGIAAFVALMLGSFIWFIATWDKSNEEPVSLNFAPDWSEERAA